MGGLERQETWDGRNGADVDLGYKEYGAIVDLDGRNGAAVVLDGRNGAAGDLGWEEWS